MGITGRQIRDGSITGDDVNEDTLIMKYFTTHKYTASNNNRILVRFNAGGGDNASDTNLHQTNNRFVAPTGGKLAYVAFRSTGTPNSTEIALLKISDGVTNFGHPGSPSADVTMNVNQADNVVVFDFSNNVGASFNAGQVLGIRVSPTNNHDNCDLTCVWEFDWSS